MFPEMTVLASNQNIYSSQKKLQYGVSSIPLITGSRILCLSNRVSLACVCVCGKWMMCNFKNKTNLVAIIVVLGNDWHPSGLIIRQLIKDGLQRSLLSKLDFWVSLFLFNMTSYYNIVHFSWTKFPKNNCRVIYGSVCNLRYSP